MKTLRSTLPFYAWLSGLGAILYAIMAFGCMVITGCSSTANLTTGAGLTGATVDNGSKIFAGASVTASSVSANTTVTTISGTTIVLNQVAILTGQYPATFKNTAAGQLSGDIKAYSEYAAGTFQKLLPQLVAASGDVAALTQIVKNNESLYGLTPTNAAQQSALNGILNVTSKIGSDSTTLINYLAGVQTTGSVTATTSSTSMLKVHTEIRGEYGSISRDSIYDLRVKGQKPRTMVASQGNEDLYIY